MRPYERVENKRRADRLAAFSRELRQLPLTEAALVDMARQTPVDAALHPLGERIVGLVHIDELRIAAARGQLDRMEGGRLGRVSVVGVVGMIALTGDADTAVLKLVLIGDVVDERAFRHCEAWVVLGEDLAEVLHGSKKLRRIEPLIADYQHGMLDEGAGETLAQL